MFCIDICNKQPLGEVLHSVEVCFVTSLLKEIYYTAFYYTGTNTFISISTEILTRRLHEITHSGTLSVSLYVPLRR